MTRTAIRRPTLSTALVLSALTTAFALIHPSSNTLTAGLRQEPLTCETGACGPTIFVFTGQSIQAAVDAAPPGASFVIMAGVHRLQSVRPKAGNTFTGQAGAVLSGARVITGFTQQGNVWVAGGQTPRGGMHGRCAPEYPQCQYPEELFVDDTRMRRVGSVSDVSAGTWFFDYAARRVYLGTSPVGRRVEMSVADAAFTGAASRVTIKDLTIEKYASPAQSGAVDGSKGSDWTVSGNVIRWNHGAGVSLGPSMQVRNNRILSNGQLGVAGGDYHAGIVIEGNEIAYNNEAGFDWRWEAGGSKFWATIDLVVRGNHVHHNKGPGLWTDNDNRGTLYEDNLVEDNSIYGIFHEISYAAVIRNNTVRRNGFGHATWLWGSGILVAASSDVEIYGNIVEDNAGGINAVQQDRGVGRYGPYLVRNLWIHDNTVRMSTGLNGIATDTKDLSIFTSRNNRYDGNTYYLGPRARYFEWLGTRTETEWQNYGHDVRGTFHR